MILYGYISTTFIKILQNWMKSLEIAHFNQQNYVSKLIVWWFLWLLNNKTWHTLS